MKKLLLLALIPAINAYSQGYQVNFQGQRQQGMGGAGIGNVQDVATTFFNPAGLSFLDKSAVDVSVTPVFANVSFQDNASNASNRTSSPVSTPFSLYANYKFKNKDETSFANKLGLGLGIYTPFGSTVEWEKGWAGRFAITRLELRSIFFQPTVSYKINKRISVGAGFIYTNGKVNLQKDIPTMYENGDYGKAELSGNAGGFGYNAGIYLKATKDFTVGLNYRSQINMKIAEGKADFTVPAGLATNFPDGTFSSSLPLPQVASIGFGYTLKEKWNFALDISYVGWKAYDTLAFDYASNTASLVDTKSARMYKNTLAARMGAEYRVTEKFNVRLGLAFCQSPVQDGYVTPETPDANRINYTAGLAYTVGEHLHLNASLFFTKLKRSDRNLETNLDGTFRTIAIAPGLSIAYSF